MDSTKLIENAVKITGLLVSTALVLSIIYDWGFFFSLGMSYFDVPTAMTDHFRSGLVWLPNALLLLFINLSIEYFFQRVERGLTEEEIIQASKNPESLRKFRRGPAVLVRVITPICIACFLFLGDIFRGILPFAMIVVWSMFSEWATSTPLLQLRRSATAMVLFHWLPMVFFFVFFMGYNKAADIASKVTPCFKISFIGAKAPMEVNTLRYLDKGALIIQPRTKSISILPWAQIACIETTENYKPYPGLFGKTYYDKIAPKPTQ